MSRRSETPAAEGDDIEPGCDHYVCVAGKSEAILLPCSYPGESSPRRARQAIAVANPRDFLSLRRRNQ